MDIDPRLNDIDDCLYRVAIRVLIVQGGKVLLVKEADDDWWALPGGGVDHGETIEASLVREVEEELGIPANQVSSNFEIVYYNIGNIVNAVPRMNLFFKATVPEALLGKTSHVAEWKWCTKEDFLAMGLHPSYDKAALVDVIFGDLGLERGTVQVVPYDPEWPQLFQEEKQRLEAALGDYIHDIEHIGSTSVPGLAAKPIIDMIASVDDLAVYKQLIKPLENLGYEFMPERVFNDRVFFPKGSHKNRTHHLSLVLKNSAGWYDPIAFRDYLIAHEDTCQAYQKLKERLASQYSNDRATYTKAKETMIKDIMKAASS